MKGLNEKSIIPKLASTTQTVHPIMEKMAEVFFFSPYTFLRADSDTNGKLYIHLRDEKV